MMQLLHEGHSRQSCIFYSELHKLLAKQQCYETHKGENESCTRMPEGPVQR